MRASQDTVSHVTLVVVDDSLHLLPIKGALHLQIPSSQFPWTQRMSLQESPVNAVSQSIPVSTNVTCDTVSCDANEGNDMYPQIIVIYKCVYHLALLT
jgi:hypothetical protein